MQLQKDRDTLLKSLFDKYFAHMVIFSNQIVENRTIAEDIVQEVFLGLWEKDKLEMASINYLYSCVKNASINFTKSKDGKIGKLTDSFFADLRSDNFSYEDEIEKMNQLEKLYSAIEELPPQCKEVLKKVYLEKQKYADVAKELNVSLNTVKTHMFKAFKLLRKHFGSQSLIQIAAFYNLLN